MDKLTVKKGKRYTHAAEPYADVTLCGLPFDVLAAGERRYYWIRQIGCRACRSVIAKRSGAEIRD